VATPTLTIGTGAGAELTRGRCRVEEARVRLDDADGARRRTVAYGPHEDQVGDLHLPGGAPPASGWSVAVLLHGGFWRQQYRRELMDPLAMELVGRGLAVWNLEYRRVRGAGGWPATFADVAAGIDHLAGQAARGMAHGPRLAPGTQLFDLGTVTVVGHSAGGHLGLWAAGRGRLPDGAPGARPKVLPAGVVALAPVADLRAAAAAGLSDGAARELLGGGPDEHPARWCTADPIELVGHRIPVLLLHGVRDEDVPLAQSERYHAVALRAGDPVELVTGPWGHLDLIDPAGSAWPLALAALGGRSGDRSDEGPGGAAT
jgi:acetyl esterase/lipase